jgi:hypothetical protein
MTAEARTASKKVLRLKKAAPQTAVPQTKAIAGLPQKRHDWEKVRTLFVERMDPVTLREVAEAMGINYTVLRNRAAQERWTAQRAEFQMKAALVAAKTRIRTLVKEGQGFDDQSLQTAKVGQTLVAGRLAQMSHVFVAQQGAYNSAVQRLRAGQPVEKSELYSPISYKELVELAKSLELFQKVGKLAIGIDVTTITPQQLQEQLDDEQDDDVSIADELSKPDADRLAAFMDAMDRSGILHDLMQGNEVFDAEVIEDDNAVTNDTSSSS